MLDFFPAPFFHSLKLFSRFFSADKNHDDQLDAAEVKSLVKASFESLRDELIPVLRQHLLRGEPGQVFTMKVEKALSDLGDRFFPILLSEPRLTQVS
jgi:hypothetical protein